MQPIYWDFRGITIVTRGFTGIEPHIGKSEWQPRGGKRLVEVGRSEVRVAGLVGDGRKATDWQITGSLQN